MVVSEIQLYEMLKAKIGEKEAEAFVNILEQRVEKKFEEAKDTLATKADIHHLEVQLAETKADLIKWTFVFWVGSIGVLSGIIFAMLHAYLK